MLGEHPFPPAGKAPVSTDLVPATDPDVVLVGGGVMSATLASLLGIVAPDWSITVFESGPAVAGESSGPWNNAGTGHAALCELNYTPAGGDGSVDVTKAVTINEQFQVSRQFWSHLVRSGLTGSPKEFITPVPHVSFVAGDAGRAYMRTRHGAMSAQPVFEGLEYTDDPGVMAEWLPLMMAGRPSDQVVAATRSAAGTDVDFGSLTQLLFGAAEERGVHVHVDQRVTDVERRDDGRWTVTRQRPSVSRSRPVTRWLQCTGTPRSAASSRSRRVRAPKLTSVPAAERVAATTCRGSRPAIISGIHSASSAGSSV